MSRPFNFTMTDDARALGIRGIYLRITGLSNSEKNEDFERTREELSSRLRSELSNESIKSDKVLQGFRDLHTKVGRSNRNYPSAPEALLSLVSRRGLIPSINLAVDIYNSVSLQTRLALGAHDMQAITGDVRLAITNGSEKFIPLGAVEPEPVGAGEYSYIDDDDEILCRMEYKQVEKTKVGPDTTDCFYIIQGHAGTPEQTLRDAATLLTTTTQRYCGGEVERVWEFL